MSEDTKLEPNEMVGYAYQTWQQFRPELADLGRHWRNDERKTMFSHLVGLVFAWYIQKNSEWSLHLEFEKENEPLAVIVRSKWQKEIYFQVEVTHMTMALISDDRTSIERFTIFQPGYMIVNALSKMIIDAINTASEAREAELDLCAD